MLFRPIHITILGVIQVVLNSIFSYSVHNLNKTTKVCIHRLNMRIQSLRCSGKTPPKRLMLQIRQLWSMSTGCIDRHCLHKLQSTNSNDFAMEFTISLSEKNTFTYQLETNQHVDSKQIIDEKHTIPFSVYSCEYV